MTTWFSHRLQVKLILAFAAVLLVPTLLTTAYGISQARRELLETARLERLHLAQTKAQAVENMLTETTTDLLFLTQTPPIRRYANGAPAAIADAELFFQTFLQRSGDRYRQICLLNLTGVEVSCVRMTDGQPRVVAAGQLVDQANSTYFTGALSLTGIPGRQPVFISNLTEGQPADEASPHLNYATMLESDQGETVGVLVLEAWLAPMLDILQTPNLTDQQLFLVDSQGQYLYHPTPQRQFGVLRATNISLYTDLPHNAGYILAHSSGVLSQTADRPNAMQVFARIRPRGQGVIQWTVIYEQSLVPLFSRLAQTTYVILTIVAAGFAAAILLASLLTRSIVRPVRLLSEAAYNISQGKLDTPLPVIKNQDEIGMLGHAFARMTHRLKESISDLQRRVDELEEARQQLHQSEQFNQDVLNSLAARIAVIDDTGAIIAVNEAWRRFDEENAADSSWPEAVEANDFETAGSPPHLSAVGAAQMMQGFQEVLNGHLASYEFEYPAPTPQQKLWFSCRIVPLRGQIGGVVVAHIDITAMKQAETQAAQLAAVIEQATETVLITDLAGTVVYVNPYFEISSGYAVAEALGKNPRLVQSGWQDTAFYQELWQTITNGKTWHGMLVNRRKNGQLYHEEASIFPVKNSEGKVINYAAVKRDVTSRIETEEQLRLLAAAIESTDDGILITTSQLDNPGPDILFVNRGLCRMFGYQPDELIGQMPYIFYGPDTDRRLLATIKKSQLNGQLAKAEMVNYRKDGTTFVGAWHISPVFGKTGQLTHYTAIVQDVTAVRQLENHVRQTQKMEAIGQLAGGVAHDFNNILTAIIGFAELLLMQPVIDDASARRDIEQIRRSADRATRLTRQLLAFSRQQMLQPRLININTILLDMEKMLNRLIRENIELRIQPGQVDEPIYADPGQIEQVIMNLVVNARDAMPTGGQLTITTATTRLDDTTTPHCVQLPPGPYVMLSIHDTGVGIDPAIRDRIFEPFFTTKDVGQGTGLGLATIHGIVTQSQGCIEVDSEPGSGTTFTIYLPQVNKEDPAVIQQQGVSWTGFGTETVLLVEDEANLRNIASQTLRQFGYTVLPAANGPEAQRLSTQYRQTIHLLLTDIVMPGGMSGYELAQHLQQEHDDLKLLCMSGYVDQSLRQSDLPDNCHMLSKPFTPTALVTKVRQVLDS